MERDKVDLSNVLRKKTRAFGLDSSRGCDMQPCQCRSARAPFPPQVHPWTPPAKRNRHPMLNPPWSLSVPVISQPSNWKLVRL
jgi:hypothetical protein